MNRPRTTLRRTVAGLVCALLGFAGAIAITSPASAAQDAEMSATCAWDSGEWVVAWTLTSSAPAEVANYRVVGLTATPDGGALEGITPTDPEAGFPHDAHQPLTGTQRLPDGTTAASLSVLIEWDNGLTAEPYGEVSIPDGCEAPQALPTELGEWSFDCDALTITIDNSTGEDVALTFAPSVGDPVDVGVAGGESATVTFPSASGLAVDVQIQGQSIVDPAEPIEITPAAWAERTCEAGGEGGDLPATGRPIALIAVGAVVLLGAGVGLFLIARRRRIIFTA